MSKIRALSLVALSGACAGALAWFSGVVFRDEANAVDAQIHTWMHEHSKPAFDSSVDVVKAISAPAFLVTATLATASIVRHHGRSVSLPIAFSPLGAMTTGSIMTKLMPLRFPPDAAERGYEPCFPSGHTTGATAEVMTTSYVLFREGLIPPSAVALLLAIPLAAGCARVYRGRHWSSDVVAGWMAGAAISALAAASYETFRETSRSAPSVKTSVQL